jgi:hypothetical protein
MKERHRFDVIDQEQLAAQLVAMMDAHFQRPSAEEKRHVLRLALNLASDQNNDALASGEVRSLILAPP